jgi:arabinogalactan oligomer/maltooligosaccharide transport system permease protein
MTALTQANARKGYRSHKRAVVTRNVIIYIFLIIMSVIWLIPFLYLIGQSFASSYAPSYFFPVQNPAAGQPGWTFNNYVRLFTDKTMPFWKWYLNTLAIAIITTVVETVMVLGTSYAFSRLRFKLRKPLMKLILVLGMFPSFLSMIIIYFILKLGGLQQSIYSLILIYVASSAMQYYIAKGFFDTIPKSLDEAAMIDGANKNTIFFKVIMPLSKPIVVYTALIAFTAPWGDFMMASYLAGGNTSMMTVAVGMQTMLGISYISSYFNVFCAGGVFISIPIVALFFWLQKYYVEGITGGAVKG